MPGPWHWKHFESTTSLPGASGNPIAWGFWGPGFCCAAAGSAKARAAKRTKWNVLIAARERRRRLPWRLRLQRLFHALRRERHVVQPLAAELVDRVRHRGRHPRPTDLAQSARRGVALDERHLHRLGQVRHAQQVIVVEVALLDHAVLYRDALVQHAREPVEDAALDV